MQRSESYSQLIPVGILPYSCTVIVSNLTGNGCSATLVCYCLGTDKEPAQLNHRTKTSRIFYHKKKNPTQRNHTKRTGYLPHDFLLNNQSVQT